jgi:hypothetical protein
MAKFVPGQSGNPGGRPKSAYLSELARAQTDACIETLVKLRDNARTPAAARIAAVKELLDRGYGKARHDVTLGSDDERATELVVRWVDVAEEKASRMEAAAASKNGAV